MPLQRLGELVVLRLRDLLAVAVGRQVVRLVEDHEIPRRRFEQPLDARRALERVDAGDEPVVLGEGVRLAVGDVALAAEHLEVEVEDLVQLAVPVVDEARGHDHQRAVQLAAACQFAQDQRRLDRLAEPDLVGDQEAARRRRRDAMRQHDLMRQQIDLRRGQRRGALHERQRMRLVREPRLASTVVATRDRADDAVGRERNGWSAVTATRRSPPAKKART